MPPEQTPATKTRKRHLSTEAEPTTNPPSQPDTKRRKLEKQPRHKTPSSFWDNLSRQWLTPRALQEFDRRTAPLVTPLPPDLSGLKGDYSGQLKRFARHGGPNLGDIRAYPEPPTSDQSIHTMSSRSRAKFARTSNRSSTKSLNRKTSAYDGAFQQHLIDHGVYPKGYGGMRNLQAPHNWEEINARLALPRTSLSPSRFNRESFLDFTEKNDDALTEAAVMSKAFPIIAGSTNIPHAENLPFGNLEDLTDGSIVKEQPDWYDGTLPAELNEQIREEFGPYVVPSTNTAAPCLPNFFVEGKGPTGSAVIGGRQACYDGALGARGIHKLRSYTSSETLYDNNAYTITSTYHGATGDLTIYTTHPTLSSDPGNPVKYHMTQLNGWKMTGNPDAFRQGASALRNARDWAKEQRDALITAVNGRVLDMPTDTSTLESSEYSVLSSLTNEPALLESNTSADELA